MPIPASFLDELKSRVSIADVAGRYVTWDRAKSNFPKGDYYACCPFHHEKTPSFHVDDRKGYFYCFGCHEKGSALDLAMKLGNMAFRDAVEDLARGVGMTIPEEDPRERARAAKRLELADAMEAAVGFFRQMLQSGPGAEARRYLAERRGLDREAIDRFEIGFAPDAFEALTPALVDQGFSPDQLIEAGLSKRSDRGRAPYDLFRNRIMFPIRDPRGRCIAFGGRAMSAEDAAKYLNSPATPLFDKSRTLYNLGSAQVAAAAGQPLIVAEGYMDVIALVRAGFEGAVAPLGTALTEAHLQQLWKRVDAPVLALDGDVAGRRAAHRSAEVALPHLAPGKTLRMTFLPNGQDPDDLLKGANGPTAMAELVEKAAPLVEVLWDRAAAEADLSTPESRAAFEAGLDALVGRIQHPMVRNQYQQMYRDRKYRFFRSLNAPIGRGGGGARARGGAPLGPRPETLASEVAAGATAATRMRECVMIAALLRRPEICEQAQEALETIELINPQLDAARNAILSALIEAQEQEDGQAGPDPARLAAAVDRRCGSGTAAAVCAEASGRTPRPLAPDAPLEGAVRVLRQMIRHHSSELCWIRERAHYLEEVARADAPGDPETPTEEEASTADLRLQEAHAAAHQPHLDEDEDPASTKNGENSSRLQSFVDAQPWKKRKQRLG